MPTPKKDFVKVINPTEVENKYGKGLVGKVLIPGIIIVLVIPSIFVILKVISLIL